MASHILKNKKKYYSKIRFGGLYDEVLKRDNYTCQTCNFKKKIIIHHRDGNVENNNIDNLVVVCHQCHYLLHCKIGTYPNKIAKTKIKERKKTIEELRKNGYTLAKIGKKFSISRQRVFQILEKA